MLNVSSITQTTNNESDTPKTQLPTPTQQTSKFPSDAQIKASMIKMEKIIKGWLDLNEVTKEDLDNNLISVTLKPSWSDKEFMLIYSYTFKSFERTTPRFLYSAFIDSKIDEIKFEYLK